MLHACFVSTLLCFVYTLRCFYIFSETNLLTSCHSASCMFSSVFGSRKSENQYYRNWTGQKPNSLFFSEQHGTTKQSRRGTTRWPHLPRHGQALEVPTGGVGPLDPHRP